MSNFIKDMSNFIRFCGYCGKSFSWANITDFFIHLNWCEVDRCNKKFGDLQGK
jgi:hypothetical protein